MSEGPAASPLAGRLALVTGGGGFLGSAIVRGLLARGARVRSLARGAYPELAASGVDVRRGDVADAEAVRAAAEGCEVVFHVAALAGAWGPRADYLRTNVTGTENVLAACRAHAIRSLVHTSTPSVVHGGDDIEGGDESLPYATHFEAAYPETKMLAERRVLAASGPALATVALRPHLIWGPGDTQLIPRLLARARAGRARIVGSGEQRVDATWIEDAAEAHLLAAERLAPGAACAGRAYFVSQGEPWPAARLMNAILEAAGHPPVTRRVPRRLAWCAGAALEAAWRVLGREGEPPITRFVATQLGTAHWFEIGAARRDLGYAPGVTMGEAMARLRDAFAAQAAGAADATLAPGVAGAR